MARRPKPWYWKERKSWYVTILGTRHNLGEEKKAAFDEYHDLMAKPQAKLKRDAVATILDDFQTWTKENRAPRTAARYGDFLQSFIKKHGLVRVSDLHAGHVTTWLNDQTGWNSTTKRNAITAVQRAFNWAVKNRGLDRNPIKGMEKPDAKRRTTIISAEEFNAILSEVKDQPFRDLLVISYDCGARPFEIKRLEARHVQLDKQRAIIPTEEAKRGITRAIYFPSDRSMAVVTRLIKEHPTGPLLLNNRRRPWTGMAVKCRFEDLQKKLGKRYTHYSLRHSFITRKLVAGVDSHVVAALAGHRDTKMIDSVYSHVADDHEFMLQNAKKETSASVPRQRKSK